MLVFQVLLAGLSLLICTFAMPIGRALGVLDLPDGRRKLHARATPLVGGIAVIVPVLLMAAWQAVTTDFTPLYTVLGGAILSMTLLGMRDDRRHISASLRLGIECAIVLTALFLVPGLRIEYLWLRFADTPLFLGAWGGGYLFDRTGSYDIMWWASAALGVFAALVHWPIVEKPVARAVAA